jgi:signal transduction histidine kinase
VRLILIFAAIALITYLFSGLSLYSSLEAQLLRLEEHKLAQRTAEVATLIETSLANGQSLEAATSELHLLPAFGYGLRVEDRNGRLINEYLPASLQIERSASATFDEVHTLPDGRRYLILSQPLQQQQAVVGRLTLFALLTSIDDALVELNPQLYLALIATLVAIAGAGAFIGGGLSRTLGEIEAAAKAIAQGQFDHRIQVRGNDEVGRLAATINDMAFQLATLRRSRAQFFSKVSHELRTPLTIIKGFAITLLRRDDLDPQMKRQINIINQQTDNLTRLVDDLLDLARVDVKKLTLQRELTNLVNLVEDVVDSYQVLSLEKNQALQADMKAAELPVLIDPQRIKQVISILLDNAFKYAGDGDEIVVRVAQEGENALLAVADNGPGIPQENLPHVFERFYQVEPTHGGMGVGLALARELVKAHNGEITAENRPRGGCQFTILLPLASAVPEQNGRYSNQPLPTYEPVVV